MEILKRIQHKRYTHLGISKKKKLHVGWWDNDKNTLLWKLLSSLKETDKAIIIC